MLSNIEQVQDREMPGGTVILSTRWEAFIIGLTILSLCNIFFVAFARLNQVGQVAITVEIVISAVFLGDFFRRLWVATNRRRYFLRGYGWLDLIGCAPILRIARVVHVTLVLRHVRRAGGVERFTGRVFANRAQGSLLLVVLIAIYVIELGSMAMLTVESQSDDANITTSSDALWFMVVTISTVGYGDLYPTTNLGRLVGVVIIIVGVGLFSTLTGFLANLFVSPRARAANNEASQATIADPTDGDDVPAIS